MINVLYHGRSLQRCLAVFAVVLLTTLAGCRRSEAPSQKHDAPTSGGEAQPGAESPAKGGLPGLDAPVQERPGIEPEKKLPGVEQGGELPGLEPAGELPGLEPDKERSRSEPKKEQPRSEPEKKKPALTPDKKSSP
jgi:hypothetical protein